MKTVQIFSILMTFILLNSCGIGSLFITSDVPCVNIADWNAPGTFFNMRSEIVGSKNLLFMYQSIEDREIDISDGNRNFQPRRPIYRYDNTSNTFSSVEDEAWERANTDIISCNPENLDTTFTITDGHLEFDGQEVQITGRTLLDIYSAPVYEGLAVRVAAILSTDGFMVPEIFIFPSTRATGQHYHQLFSEITGQPLSPPLRIGIGGLNQTGIFTCWTLDKMYVIYSEVSPSAKGGGFSGICVVDIEDEIQSVTGN